MADQVFHGLTRFGAKAVGSVVAAGPVAGAGLLGTEEANTIYRDLTTRGIDSETALKVAAVQGAISAAGVVLPISGAGMAATTAGKVGATAALVGIGGPGAYVAQETLARDILQRAGYADEAGKHDPTDPLGLAISTILPGAFGAASLRGALRSVKQIPPIKTEAGVRDAVQLSPGEQAASDAFERSAGNLAELRKEIARTKDPAAKAVLEAELATQTQAAANAGRGAVAEAAARSPEVVDAARVKVLQETVQRGLPESPDAYPRLMEAIDDVAAGRAPDTTPIPGYDFPMPPRMVGDLPAPAEVSDGLRTMAGGAFWAERGGQMIRDPRTATDPGSATAMFEGDVVGRTKWIPADEWFGRMRAQLGADGLTKQADISAAVEAAIEGRPLKARERRTVDWMRSELDEMQAAMQRAEFAPEEAGMLARDSFDLGLSSRDAPDLAIVTRAAEKDADAVERAAIMHEDDDAAFMAAIRRILGDEQSAAGRPEVSGEGFGGSSAAARAAEERPGAAGLADTGRPASDIQAAGVAQAKQERQIVDALAAERPDMMVTLPGTNEAVRLADAVEMIRAQQALDESDADLVRAAVLCDLSP